MLIRTPRDLGAVIRNQRRQLGWSQQQLAEKVGVGRQWVIAVERGKPRAEIGLVLRTLDVLALRLSPDHVPVHSGDDGEPVIDIDRIVENARRPAR